MPYTLFEESADFEDMTQQPSDSELMHSIGRRQETSGNATGRAWHGTAFVLEVVVILLFVVVSMAVVCSMFGKSYEIDQEADTLTRAITLATTGAKNGAETFAANPADEECPAQLLYTFDGDSYSQASAYTPGTYVVRRVVESDETGAGTLYRATIEVSRYNEVVYTLSTAKYVSAGRSNKESGTQTQGGDQG